MLKNDAQYALDYAQGFPRGRYRCRWSIFLKNGPLLQIFENCLLNQMNF
jgi:hypothetical protein